MLSIQDIAVFLNIKAFLRYGVRSFYNFGITDNWKSAYIMYIYNIYQHQTSIETKPPATEALRNLVIINL